MKGMRRRIPFFLSGDMVFIKEKRYTGKGYTFLEIMLVIAILSLTISVALPVLTSFSQEKFLSSLRILSAIIEKNRRDAAYSHENIILFIELESGIVFRGGDETTKLMSFPKEYSLIDAVSPSEGKKRRGRFAIRIDPYGMAEPAVLHFETEKGKRKTVFIHAFRSSVDWENGYVEEEAKI